jgi:type I restriction enzyme M protein
LTLAHFGFGKHGEALGDDALPANLTAEWLADEHNTGKPFPSYARMLQHHGKGKGESRYSWTVDFAARRAKAREEMQPLQEKAAEIRAAVVDRKETLRRLKKDKANEQRIAALEAQIREHEKTTRDLESQAAAIDAAVFDLKAVNPNVVAAVDERTPGQIIESIAAQGQIVAQALTRLNALMAAS